MGKGNWKCQVSVSTSDNTNTSMKVKVTCIWDSNDWSYNMNSITGWVYINGKEYEVYSGSINCSSDMYRIVRNNYRDTLENDLSNDNGFLVWLNFAKEQYEKQAENVPLEERLSTAEAVIAEILGGEV